MRLQRSFFLRPPEVVARELLGTSLFFNGIHVMIVETESYGINDPACHAFRGKTRRNEPMFEEGGRSYVYFIYGVHYCFNVVTQGKDIPSAVLIRGAVPLNGLEQIEKRRGKKIDPARILIGPGTFCRGLGIAKEQNNLDLCMSSDFYFYSGDLQGVSLSIGTSPRVGISKGKERLWRFFLKNFNVGKINTSRTRNIRL